MLLIAFLLPIVLVAVHHVWSTQYGRPPSPPPADFGNGQMFDQIATRYDLINRVLALRMDVGWRRTMTGRIKELLLVDDEQKGQEDSVPRIHLLDMATGTADVALQLAAEFAAGAPSSSLSKLPTSTTVTVLGLDPSPNMLSLGRIKVTQKGLDNVITLEQADARDLSLYYPMTTNQFNHQGNAPILEPFDAATMAFGIRNIPERQQALCEIYKLLRPGGVLAILEFSEPTDDFGVLGRAARIFIRHVVPTVGAWLSGAPREYAHLQNSIQDFPKPDEFQAMMQNLECEVAGVPNVEDHGEREQIQQQQGGEASITGTMTGYFDMEEIQHMNFGSVQLYVGRAATRSTTATEKKDTQRQSEVKLPPIIPRGAVDLGKAALQDAA